MKLFYALKGGLDFFHVHKGEVVIVKFSCASAIFLEWAVSNDRGHKGVLALMLKFFQMDIFCSHTGRTYLSMCME